MKMQDDYLRERKNTIKSNYNTIKEEIRTLQSLDFIGLSEQLLRLTERKHCIDLSLP